MATDRELPTSVSAPLSSFPTPPNTCRSTSISHFLRQKYHQGQDNVYLTLKEKGQEVSLGPHFCSSLFLCSVVLCPEVPAVVQQKRIRLGTMMLQLRSLSLLCGLRIWCCRELWCRSQTRLGFCIAVAVV